MAKKLTMRGIVGIRRGNKVPVVWGEYPEDREWIEDNYARFGEFVTIYWHNNMWQIAREKVA